MQNTTEDTEWNDVLRRKGILPPKPSEAEITEEEIENMVECVVKTYTSTQTKPEDLGIDDLEDLEDELDEKVFLEYRQKRIAEMKAQFDASKFGTVIEITGQDYVQEINKAGEGVWVVLHLYKQGIPLCSLLNEHLRLLSSKFPMAKFVKSQAALCIPNYPDQNLPTIFIYHNGELKHKFIGPSYFTPGLKLNEFEWMLAEVGAINTEIEKDPRPKIQDTLFSQLKCSNVRTGGGEEEDSDW